MNCVSIYAELREGAKWEIIAELVLDCLGSYKWSYVKERSEKLLRSELWIGSVHIYAKLHSGVK